MDINNLNMTIPDILKAYRDSTITPLQLIDHLLAGCEKFEDYNIWITRLSRQQIQPYIDNLEQYTPEDLPLYGIPFAIKDNIDLKGVSTTAACADFAYQPEEHAHVVARLIKAGAIPIGKTNLDQFATGLVGVRSPWGACKNSFDPDYISGGSSAGSAVALALGLVSFSLGTDTAGSGRVPAAFNNVIGFKPSKGLLSAHGIVPACRSNDCVSIFSLTTDDANLVFEIAADFDGNDPYSRPNLDTNKKNYGFFQQDKFNFAIPSDDQLEFFGNLEVRAGFKDTVKRLEELGGVCEIIDFEAFLQAARLLYEGPWVAERRVATEAVDYSSMLPVIQKIMATQLNATAEDLFKAEYQLQACYQKVQPILNGYDFLLTPTTGTIYTIEQVQNDPVNLNSNLGYYTNFMNLLDCSAIAIPAGLMNSGLPFGITFFSCAFNDTRLLSFANLLQQKIKLHLGATQHPLPLTQAEPAGIMNAIEIVVCGAHLEGLPLNWQLTDRGAQLVKKTKSAASYRLFALAGGPPYRPGMMRDKENGESIEVEVWSLPTAQLGSFVAGIPQPLGIGKIELQDGRWLSGFICEGYAIEKAKEITEFRGWRGFIEAGIPE